MRLFLKGKAKYRYQFKNSERYGKHKSTSVVIMSNFNAPTVTGSSWIVVKLNSAWLRATQIFLFHIPINYRRTVSVFVLKCTITGDTNKPFFFLGLELTFLKYHITHLAGLKHAPIFTCVALVSHAL